MVIAMTFLNEKLTYQIIIAAVLIFIGVNLITLQNENQIEWKNIDLV